MKSQPKDMLEHIFYRAARDVITTMADLELCEDVEYGEEPETGGKITGVMLLIGETKAMLSLSVCDACAAMLVTHMTGMAEEELTQEELYDGVAELVNMVAGRAKAMLAGTSYHYQLTPPFAIVGDRHSIYHRENVRKVGMCFTVCGSPLRLELFFFVDKKLENECSK